MGPMFIRLLFLSLIFPLVFLHAEVKIITTVNGEVISNIDIMTESKILASLSNTKLTEENHAEFLKKANEYLINEIIFRNKAKELNIIVTEEEVQEAISNFINSPKLSQYIKDNNINNNFLTKQIRSKITQEKVIAKEVAAYVTVTQQEIEDFKEHNTKFVTMFEIARVKENNENYLGLFSQTELNPNLVRSIESINVGSISADHQIKLLDRIEVKKSSLNDRFDFIKIKSENVGNINQFLSKKDLSCNNYQKHLDGLTNVKINNFKPYNTKSENSMYKQLLKMNTHNNISRVVKDNKEHFTLILCKIISNHNEDTEILEEIFKHKLAIQAEVYIKNLKQNSIINRND